MSVSPPINRRPNLSLSSSRESLKREEDLINAYEYEEERISNTLSRKLERLRHDKTQLENALEAEGESQVDRLARQLSTLRQAQHQNVSGSSGSQATSSFANGTEISPRRQTTPPGRPEASPSEPNTTAVLEALRRENDSLRRRLTDAERDYIRVTRMNDIYREELIQHRIRLGIPLDSLIGLAGPSLTNSPAESFSQPSHLRNAPSRNISVRTFGPAPSEPRRTSSPPNRATGATPIPIHPQPVAPLTSIITTAAPAAMGVPIPRSSSQRMQGHSSDRRHPVILSSTSSSSASTEPSTTTSPSSSLPPSPFTFSPPATNVFPGSRSNPGRATIHGRHRSSSDAYSSYNEQDMALSSGTHVTTPPSSNASPFFPFQLPIIHQQVPLTLPLGGGGLGFGGFAAGSNIHYLSYPTAPPPSLSSSLGASPITSRRGSVGPHQRPSHSSSPTPLLDSPIVGDAESSGSLGSGGSASTEAGDLDEDATNMSIVTLVSPSASANPVPSTGLRRTSVERGARIAETGSLLGARRRGGGSGRGRKAGSTNIT